MPPLSRAPAAPAAASSRLRKTLRDLVTTTVDYLLPEPKPSGSQDADDALLSQLSEWGRNNAAQAAMYEDIHREFYGKPAGAVCGSIPHLAGIFPGFADDLLLVRDEYPRVFSWVQERFAELCTAPAGSRDARQSHCLVLFGSPGIGKSSFLPYLVLRRLEEGKPVALYRMNDPAAVVFIDTGVFLVSPEQLPYIAEKLRTPLVLALDSAPTAAYPVPPFLTSLKHSITVVAASPRSSRYTPFAKHNQSVAYWVLTPPGLEEIRNAISLQELDVTLPQMEHRFYLGAILPGTVNTDRDLHDPITAGQPFRSQLVNGSFEFAGATTETGGSTAGASSAPARMTSGSAAGEGAATTAAGASEVGDTAFSGSAGAAGAAGAADAPGAMEEDSADAEGGVVSISEYEYLLFGNVTVKRLRAGKYYAPEEIYAIAAPAFRSAFVKTTKSARVADDFSESLAATRNMEHLVDLLKPWSYTTAVNEAAQPTGYDRLVTLVPNPDYEQPTSPGPRVYTVIATPFLREALRIAYRSLIASNQLRLASSALHSPVMHGILFESFAIRQLSSGPVSSPYRVHLVDAAGNDVGIDLPSSLTEGLWNPNKQVFPRHAGLYILPPYFAAANAVLVLHDPLVIIILQATISPTHPIKKSGIAAIVSRIPFSDRPRLVYAFVTPDETTATALLHPPRPTLSLLQYSIAAYVPAAFDSVRAPPTKKRGVELGGSFEKGYLVVTMDRVEGSLMSPHPQPQSLPV